MSQNSCKFSCQIFTAAGDTPSTFSPWNNPLHLHQSAMGGIVGSRPWQERAAFGQMYQQRAPSPWALGHEPYRGWEEPSATDTMTDVNPTEPVGSKPGGHANVDATMGNLSLTDAPIGSWQDVVDSGAACNRKEGSLSDEGRRKALEAFATAETPMSKEDLYTRLCGIFEEEKVKYVMNAHPDEIYPQKICSLILAYFPSK